MATEKKMHPVLKVAVLIGAIGITGTVGYYSYQGFKKWQARKNNPNSDTMSPEFDPSKFGYQGEGSTVTLPPPTNEEKSKSYEDIRKFFGNTVLVYTDHIEKTIPVVNGQIKVAFYNNGRFFIFKKPSSSNTWSSSTKGDYQKGGKYLVITDGAKKGQIKSSSDILANIKNAA